MQNSDLQREVFNLDVSDDSTWNHGELYDEKIRLSKTIRLLQDIIKWKENVRILDVWVGGWYIISHANSNGNKLYWLDIAEQKNQTLKDIEVRACDFENDNFPFEDDFFDIVICTEVIEHILNTDNLLNEINRVLKTSWKLLISFPNVNQPVSWWIWMFLDYPPKYCSRYKSVHVRDWTSRIMLKVLGNYKFNVSKKVGTFVWPIRAPILWDIFTRFSDNIIFIAEKHEKSSMDERKVIWFTNEI